jgi:hypothetical protein
MTRPHQCALCGKHLPDVPFERRTYDSTLGDNGGDEFIGGDVKGRITPADFEAIAAESGNRNNPVQLDREAM